MIGEEPLGAVDLSRNGSPVPVLVLRRSLADLQHCVLAVARTLGRLGVPVYAVRSTRREPATRSRYIAGELELTGGANTERWVDQLMALDPKLSGGILLPIDDVAAVTVADHQEALSTRFRLPQQPLGLARRLSSKRALVGACHELDVPTPETTLAASFDEAAGLADRYGYPVVLKRDEAWGGAEDAAGPSVLIVNRSAELHRAYDSIRVQSPEVPNVLVQEYIPGGSDSVWMFNGYFDADSRCLCAFTGQKLRQCRHGAGQTTLGICTDNQTVVDLALRLMQGLGYRGIVDMGFRFDARDGRYKLLDVNPRLGSTFRLFAAPDGSDVARAMYWDLTGRPVPPMSAQPSRTWLDEAHDVAEAVWLVRGRQLSLAGWARSVAGASEAAWWAKDDPIPFLAMAASLPRHMLSARAARRREERDEAGSTPPAR